MNHIPKKPSLQGGRLLATLPQISGVDGYPVLNSSGVWTANEVELSICNGRSLNFVNESISVGTTRGTVEPPLPTHRIFLHDLEFVENFISRFSLGDQHGFDDRLNNLRKQEPGIHPSILMAVSLAYAKATANHLSKPLWLYLADIFGIEPGTPSIISNVLNAGPHAGTAPAFPEIMVIPRSDNFSNQLQSAVACYAELQRLTREKFNVSPAPLGLESGVAPPLPTTRDALLLLREAINCINQPNRIDIAIDVAASTFFDETTGTYLLENSTLSINQLVDYYQTLVDEFPEICFLEDPIGERDITGWKMLRHCCPNILLVADDHVCCQPERIPEDRLSCNGVVLKPDRASTVCRLADCFVRARKAGHTTVISHRSVETDSPTLAHLAVAFNADFIKAGAPARERIVKYNWLLRLERQIHRQRFKT